MGESPANHRKALSGQGHPGLVGRLKERLESLKIEQLEVELGLMLGELAIPGGK